MQPREPLYVLGSGHAHPPTELTSGELEANTPGLWEGWSRKYLGIQSRRVLAPHERAVALGVDAARSAMTRSQWADNSVDLIVCGVTYPDQILPPSASYVAHACSREAVAFDVAAACTSNIFSLATLIGLFAVEPTYQRALLCAIDHATAWADYSDARSSVFFGDAAGVLAVGVELGSRGGFEILGVELAGEADDPESVFIPPSGSFRSDGRKSLAQLMKMSRVVIDRLFERHDIAASQIAWCVPHQANFRIIDDLVELIGMPRERIWHNYEWAGNQGASGMFTAFSQGWRESNEELVDGDLMLWVCVGAGHTAGAALLQWHAPSGANG